MTGRVWRVAESVLSVLVWIWLTSSPACADEARGYYRWPTVFGEQIVFTSEGDLWSAPIGGGLATRLTTAPGEERFAMFSPDGKFIAFSGNYDGNTDVYVMPAGGGEPKRLTFHPEMDLVAGWTNDGKVVYRSRMETISRLWKCYAVSAQGGYPEALPVDQAAHVSFEPGGDRLAYTRVSLGGHTWKRYQGGWAEQIYVGSTKLLDYQIVTTWPGNNSIPMWCGERIYFLRDNDARMNIHSMKPDGSDIQQHTFHTDWDVRWPTLCAGKIAYSLGADLWIFDVLTNTTRKVDVTLPSDRTQARDRFISPEDYTGDFALSPDGKRLLLGARGELFSAPTERRGLIKRLTDTPAAREKGCAYLPKGDSLLTWSDLSGEEALYLYPANPPYHPRKVAAGGGWNFEPAISPDGKYAAYGDNRRRLQLVELATGTTVTIDTAAWEIREYCWSPDSRYVAYTASQFTLFANDFSVVKIYDVTEKRSRDASDREFSSYSPAWDPNGKWLYYVSARHMNPRNSYHDWIFVVQEPDRLYALALDDSTDSPYALYADGTKPEEKSKDKNAEKEEKKESGEKRDEKAEVKIVWEGLTDRVIELPVKPGNYFALTALESKLYYLSRPSSGWADDGEGANTSLHLFDIAKRSDEKVLDGVQGYVLSGDRKKIAVRKKDGFVVMDTGATEEPKPDEDDKDAGLHLDDWVCDLNPHGEWRQIFYEAWRLQRDFFYAPNLHGVDWNAERERYGALLERIGTREELNDLVAQMISELNAGHAYIGGGDLPGAKSVGVGLLGADLSRTSGGFYRIDRILRADNWNSRIASPLAKDGLDVKEGEYLVAIDQVPTSDVSNYLELLQNKAGRVVSLSINGKPSLSGAREVVVKTISSEKELRYQEWVKGRRDYVSARTGNRVGYIHLPDMGGAGLRAWMRQYYPQCQKEALVLDVRSNMGGNIAEWILAQLDRRTWSWNVARNGQRYHKPASAFQGHLAALCDEETSSDGETFAEGFKQLGLGPLIGRRTWGGWVWIRSDKPLVDAGYYTQPEFAGWNRQSQWLIEGAGVCPDVDIQNHPEQVMSGVDEQLDEAIRILLDKLEKHPVKEPPMPAWPVKRAKS